MEFNVQLPSDAIERRRLQNRIAQRKFRQKKGQRRSTVTEDGVAVDVPPNPTIATTNSQPLNPSPSSISHHLASEGDSTPVPAFSLSVNGSSDIAPPDLDNIDLDIWDLGTTVDDGSLPNTYAAFAPETTGLPSPSRFLQELQADLTPSSVTQVASTATNDPHRATPTPPNRDEAAAVRKPLHYRRSAQLKDGPDPARQSEADDEGWVGSLHIAAAKGSDRMLEMLLRQEGTNCDERDSDGRTPLMHAVFGGHEAAARALLGYGVNIGVVDKDARSALHWAVLYRCDGILRMLLEERRRRGSCGTDGDGGNALLDVDAYDDSGWTPLHMAIHQDSEVAVHLLLEAGAHLHSKAQKCPHARKLVPIGLS